MDYVASAWGLLLATGVVFVFFHLHQKRAMELELLHQKLLHQKRAMEECAQEMTRTMEEMKATEEKIARLQMNIPMVITDAMFSKLHGATFAILDDGGHPVCCGFFVTPCGVALTPALSCAFARRKGGAKQTLLRASTHRGQEFTLDVVTAKVGALELAVLRLSDSVALPSRDFLPLPSAKQSHAELLGAPVVLIHGSIAWNAGSDVKRIARDNGYIITSNETLLQYSIAPYKGHSGAALLFRGSQVIGLHSEGFNDLEQEHSEKSPSTSADAVRLDVPEIKAAVHAAMVAPPPGAARGARRRK